MINKALTELVRIGFTVQTLFEPQNSSHGLVFKSKLISPKGLITATSAGDDPVKAVESLSLFVTGMAANEFAKRCTLVDTPSGDRNNLQVGATILAEAYPGIMADPKFLMYLLQYTAEAIKAEAGPKSGS